MKKKVAVYIATTHGPVRIERILEEPVPLSEVFLGRGIEPLGEISAEYDNFVRPGRPINKAFGPFNNISFRMDLSREIKAGKSWQLAAFIAHGLQGRGELAGPDDRHDRVIVLTGLVNADYEIKKVGHITEKLDALGSLAADTKAAGMNLEFIVPEGETAAPSHGIRLIEMFDAMTAFEFCSGTKALPLYAKERSNTPYLAILMITVLAGGGGAYVFHDTTKTKTVKKKFAAKTIPKKTGTAKPITVFERRAPEGKTCADVWFSEVEAVLKPINPKNSKYANNTLSDSQKKSLCGLQFNFKIPNPEGLAMARVKVETGKFINQQSASTKRSFIGKLNWPIDLPDFQSRVFRYHLSLEFKKSVYEVSHRVLP